MPSSDAGSEASSQTPLMAEEQANTLPDIPSAPPPAAPPPFQRHHLLPDVDLGEGPSRAFDGDDDWDDLYALIPVVVILLGIVAIAFLLWPMVSYDGTVVAIVSGGQSHVVTIDTADFSAVAIEATPLIPIDSTLKTEHLMIFQEDARRHLSISGQTVDTSAFTHVFYNAPPVAVPSNKVINRTLNMELSNKGRQYTFAALRWEVIEGGNITVDWSFDGGRPDFWVLRSKAAFELWRQDTFPPLNYQIHHEYSTEKGSYTLSNQPTDLYYFIFLAPAYFWPSFNAIGEAHFQLQFMEYDLSGTNPKHPTPVVSCETPFDHNQAFHTISAPAISHHIPPQRTPLTVLYSLLSSAYNSIIGNSNFLGQSTSQQQQFLQISRNQTYWNQTTSFLTLPATLDSTCQIITPSPQFIKQIHVLLVSPPVPSHLSGGSGHGGNHPSNETEGPNNNNDDDYGTLPLNSTTIFTISPRFRNGIGPSPIIFFVWAFCAVIGLSIAVAIGIFLVVYVVGMLIYWVRRFFGWETERSGADSDDEGPEPLPVYMPPATTAMDTMSADGGFDRRPPEYSPVDPLVVLPLGENSNLLSHGIADDNGGSVYEARRDSLEVEGGDEESSSSDAQLSDEQLWVDEDERLSPGERDVGGVGES
ncbi:hypothetical protein BDR26DRAFT_859493 [Obelidium mucronatum]|nr:hypothetical protein BDR26DRAFT_859493 [Obelidium mucronatum]